MNQSDFLKCMKETFDSVSEEQISRIIDMLFSAWKQGNSVYIIGNGGSASTATHFAADLVKTVIDKPTDKGIKAISLSDNIPLTSALVNDWGKENIFFSQLVTFFQKKDVLIAFSVHGGSGSDKDGAWSQNLPKAIEYAKHCGGVTIGFAGFDGGVMKDLCDVCVVAGESTPVVESLHVVLTHLITFCLKEKIANEK